MKKANAKTERHTTQHWKSKITNKFSKSVKVMRARNVFITYNNISHGSLFNISLFSFLPNEHFFHFFFFLISLRSLSKRTMTIYFMIMAAHFLFNILVLRVLYGGYSIYESWIFDLNIAFSFSFGIHIHYVPLGIYRM